MTNSVNLPAPYGGVDAYIPKASLQNPFCEDLLNFNITQQGVSLRHGDSKVTNLTGMSVKLPIAFVRYGDTTLFFAVNNNSANFEIRDSAGTVVDTTAANVSDISTLYFNKYLYVFNRTSLATGRAYDGAAWGAIGYTGTGLNPAGGAAYKNRAYLIQYGDAAYWYSGIDSISGACTKVDLNGVVMEKCTLCGIQPITLADNVEAETLLAFIFSNGEILFYDGPYPDSSTWGLKGRSKIGSPLNYNNILTYQGDGLVFCDSGVVSLRDLFLKGSEAAASLTVNKRIQPKWQQLVQAIRTSVNVPVGPMDESGRPKINAVWDQKTNRIIISFAYYIDSAGALQSGNFFFVFNTEFQSWFYHRSFSGVGLGGLTVDITRFQNKVYLLGNSNTEVMIWEKEGATGYTDRNTNDDAEVGYDYTMLSAPIPFPKTAVYEATQIEPIMKSDLYAQTNWNLVVDFGRQTSGNQQTDALTTSVAKPAVNVGMQNITFVQAKMSGTTTSGKTVGLDLYSYNIWYNAGEIASR